TPNKGVSYDLMPMRSGTARHFGHKFEQAFPDKDPKKAKDRVDEVTLDHDFWVTVYRGNAARPGVDPFRWRDVLAPLALGQQQPESIEDADIIIWYNSPMHHEPRAEDGEVILRPDGKVEGHRGTTPLMWTGFDMHPRGLFRGTPFYPPPPKR